MPQRNVWIFTWKRVLAVTLPVAAGYVLVRWRAWRVRNLVVFLVSALGCAAICFSMLPAAYLAPYLRGEPGVGVNLVCLVLFLGLVLLYGIHAAPAFVANHRMASILVIVFVAGYALWSPNWRQAYGELFTKGTHVQRAVAKDLAAQLPEGAVVIGERSNQVFLAHPFKTATTFPSNSDPTPIVKQLRKTSPDAPLFALVDSQHAYCMQHYDKAKTWCRLVPVTQSRLPSFGTGAPCDVYLCRILVDDAAMPE